MENKNLVWVSKKRTRYTGCRCNSDVTININERTLKNGSKKPNLAISFRNEVFNLFSDTDYVEFSIYKNRIFFRGADEYTGFKMYQNKNSGSNSKYIRVSMDSADEYSKFIGDYELKFDEFYELYYIEIEREV